MPAREVKIKVYFSDFFDVATNDLEKHGAFNVSCLSDLPLFIDPFLLFNGRKPEYQELHLEIIKYLTFLRTKSEVGLLSKGLIDRWYRFPEVKQNQMGFCLTGNSGRGLGEDFANALNENLSKLFSDFGNEKVTKGSHLEKLCLIRPNVGKDNISDFTTNLIKGFLLKYTEAFAKKHIVPSFRRNIPVDKVSFNYDTESWRTENFDLPFLFDDYVLLTPKDILTKDDIWINKHDLIADFATIRNSIPNAQLRAEIDNYFRKVLPNQPREEDRKEAARKTILQFKELIDYYIKYKEDHGDKAAASSLDKVFKSQELYVEQFSKLIQTLQETTGFYETDGSTLDETHKRILFLKDVIENKDGYKLFYVGGEPIERELDLQIMFRLTWFGTVSDVNREVNNGRGPVDFVVSRGRADKTLAEMKLAKNTGLRRNLQHQVKIYQNASDAQAYYTVILYFSHTELTKVKAILKDLKIDNSPWIVLIDARSDNKPSASKARKS
jgi:hypothetical protein